MGHVTTCSYANSKKEDFQRISEEFINIWNFPHCIGAIDGKHIRILCPKNSMFCNYKHYFSVVLQGVADANYKFIAVEIGAYGKQNDGGTFHASELYRQLKNKELSIPEPSYFAQTTTKAPFVLISDEAYPLLPFLLKPFGGTNLSFEHECFNKRLSRARKCIECAFGIITAKWRILSKSIETNIETADAIIKCISILHNVIIDKEGFQRHLSDVSVENCETNTEKRMTGRPLNEAKSIRDIFVTFFTTSFILPLNNFTQNYVLTIATVTFINKYANKYSTYLPSSFIMALISLQYLLTTF
uniref:Putative nuclease n=1 Tax=Anoplophora glabripennis TaxID=217634 RepID=V5GD51_ANOGL